MTYTPIYADIDSISRKLKGRLKIDITDTEFFPVDTVEDELLLEIIEEKESYVNSILNDIYILPLAQKQPVVKSLVEDLVMVDLLQYSFVNNNASSQDLSNLSSTLLQRTGEVIEKLTIGTILNPLPDGSLQTNRRMKLMGEVEKRLLPTTSLVNNDVFVGSLHDGVIDADFLHTDTQRENPFSSDWRNDNVGRGDW
jgi:hypothetical protein